MILLAGVLVGHFPARLTVDFVGDILTVRLSVGVSVADFTLSDVARVVKGEPQNGGDGGDYDAALATAGTFVCFNLIVGAPDIFVQSFAIIAFNVENRHS